MDASATLNLLRDTLTVLMALALPLLLVGLAVGLVISVFQAATQIQEASLVFVPKLVAVGITFWVAAPWMGEKILTFFREVLVQAAHVGGGGAF